MCKLNLILLFLLFPAIANAAAPTRSYNYVSHTTIDPAQNNANENSLYSYLQAGVDTYSAASIDNAAISGSAAIAYSKLNLIGSITNNDISTSAAIVGSKLDLTSPGAIGSTTPNAGSFTTLLGTTLFTTGNVGIGTSTATNGRLIVSGGNVGIGTINPGVALDVNGTIRGTTFTGIPSRIQIFTSNGTFVAPTGVTKVYLSMVGGGGGGCNNNNTGSAGGASGGWVINYPYTVVAGNSYTVTIGTGGAGGSGTTGSNGVATVFDALSIAGGLGATSRTAGGAGTNFNASGATPGNYISSGSGSNLAAPQGGAGGGSPFGIGAAPPNAAPWTGNTGGANTGAGGSGGSGDGGGNQGNGGTGGTGIVIVLY